MCGSQLQLGISEDEWVLLVKTIGIIKGIEVLNLASISGSQNFCPFHTIAEAVNSARSLRKLLFIQDRETPPRDPAGRVALANALRGHTGLRKFGWFDWNGREAAQSTALDPILLALPACPYLRYVTIMIKCAKP
jgi:hypothetical protein